MTLVGRTGLVLTSLAVTSCGSGPSAPMPSALAVARVLEVNLPSARNGKEVDRIAAIVRSHLPVDSEVGLIVIQYPTRSSDHRVFNARAVVFHVDSMTRVGSDTLRPGHLGESLRREVGLTPVLVYRLDVLGDLNHRKARALQEWVRAQVALFPDLDSIAVNFRGRETVQRGLRVRVGGGSVAVPARRER